MTKSLSYDELRIADIDATEKRRVFARINPRRGALLELLARVVMRLHFGIDDFEKRKTFRTPYGIRYVDLYSPSAKLSIEVKSGRIGSRRFTRNQIEKDRHILLNADQVVQTIWFCFKGATITIQTLLHDAGIQYIHMHHDDLRPDNKEIRTMLKIDYPPPA